MPDGRAVDLFTLRNQSGAEARITNYGGIVTHILVPDKHGKLGDVVLGYDHLDGYLRNNSPYFGCLIGRLGNRLAHGKFSLDGKSFQLARNNGPNHLHGGVKGFDKVVWDVVSATGNALELRYVSPDGEEGYPGTLTVTARYTFTDDHALRLDFTATTDAPTICNLTQHTYFNLADAGATDILGHELQIFADAFTPVTADLIPTGELPSLRGTPLDFSAPTKIGARINADDEQLKNCRGYDHNYVCHGARVCDPQQPSIASDALRLTEPRSGSLPLRLIARAYDSASGRVLETETTSPGVQFYSGNFLDGSITGKRGHVYKLRHGFCLEPQHFPDSPNQPDFPSVVLRPGEKYENTIVYRFSVR
jgi:aldose 1-epimerase